MTLATSHGSAARLSASWPASSAKRPVRFSVSHSRMRRRNCSSSGLTGPAPPRRRTRGPAGGVAGPRELRVWPATGRRAYAQPTKHLLHWRPPGGADGPGCSRKRSGEVRRRASPRRAGRPRISYHQLLHQTTTVTRALIAEGVTPEDRVAIWSPNTHQWVLAAFGALSAGATLVPVSTRFTGPEALDVITRSGAVRADRRPIASSAPTGSPHFAPPPRPRPLKRRTPAPVPKIPQRQNETSRVAPAPQGNCASWSACRCRVPRNRGRQPTRGTGSSAARPLLARPDRAAAEMIQMHGAIGITWNTTPTVTSSARTVRPSCSAGPD